MSHQRILPRISDLFFWVFFFSNLLPGSYVTRTNTNRNCLDSGPSIPHQTILPPQPQAEPFQSSSAESHLLPDANGWTPPPSMAVARSRAIRRFWVAFFWAWFIWIAVGYVFFSPSSLLHSNYHLGPYPCSAPNSHHVRVYFGTCRS